MCTQDLEQRLASARSSGDWCQPSSSSEIRWDQLLEKVAQSFTEKIFEPSLEWKSRDSERIRELTRVCWVGWGGIQHYFSRVFEKQAYLAGSVG